MLKQERENEIIQYLSRNGFTRVKDLCEILYASESSVRRDLAKLEKRGVVKRSYGGAEYISFNAHILPFGTRSYDYVEEKHRIAQKAVGLIKEGNIIFLDQSSTCYFLSLYLRDLKNITVVTNNIEIVNILSKTNVTVHCSGGKISRDNSNCLIGDNAQKTFENIYADIAFFSSKAVSDEGVISDCAQEEIFVRKSMFKNAEKKVFLCNSQKIGGHSSFVQCSLSDVDAAIAENDGLVKFKQKFPSLEIL